MQLETIDGVELAVQVTGTGPAFIWGHNLLGCMAADDDAGIFDWESLAANNTLIRYDARGHGESQGTKINNHYRWPNLAKDMLKLSDRLASGSKVVLGGASMGCATALQAALDAPERVAGLVLVLPPTGWKTRPAQTKTYRRMARFSGVISRLSYFMFDMLSINRDAKDPRAAMENAVAQHLGHANRDHLKAALLGAADSDMPSMIDINKLNIPTLILAWEGDDTHPVSSAIMLKDLMPKAKACHITPASGASQWNGHVKEFLASL